jgi:outer membrane protein TolC
VTARESERVLSEALASYDGHLRDAQNRREQGLAAPNEVLAVQVERDRAELWRLQARNAAELSAANLRRLLDLPGDTVIEASEPLSAPPAANPDRAALEQAALEVRPELKALQARVAAAEAGVRVQHAGALPQLSLNAGYDYAWPNNRVLPLRDEWRQTWYVGLTLGLVAFDGGRISAATAQARAQWEALRQQFVDVQRRVRLEVAQRVLEAGTARAGLAVAEGGLASARENVRVAGDRYREGVSPSAELLDAETALLRASLSRTEAQASLRIALAGLERAVGR